MELTGKQLQRYRRHIALPEIGKHGQEQLLEAKVLIVGIGGLGSAVGYYLSAAGVGTIALVDNDEVALSNLQRQIAHNSMTLGKPKVESAKSTFQSLNPDVTIIPIQQRLAKNNIRDLIHDFGIVVDCSDNYETRFLINDSCIMAEKKLVTGAVYKFEGQIMVIIPGKGACYRCFFEKPPPPDTHPEDTGLLGVMPGIIGTLQAAEVLKIIAGIGEALTGELLVYDALKASFRKIKIPTNPACPVCGNNPTITGVMDHS